jgi:SMI1 / KNR4 family (SUKH-1)
MAVEIASSGQLDEAQLDEIERRLGLPLPDDYRRWLAQTNGGKPARAAVLPGLNFRWEHRAHGLCPDEPLSDLVYCYGYFRDRFPAAWLPVAPLSGGILAVKVQGEQAGSVWYWDADEPGEGDDEEDPGELERRLRFCAASWEEFLQGLRPSGWDADEQAEEELLRRMQIDF